MCKMQNNFRLLPLKVNQQNVQIVYPGLAFKSICSFRKKWGLPLVVSIASKNKNTKKKKVQLGYSSSVHYSKIEENCYFTHVGKTENHSIIKFKKKRNKFACCVFTNYFVSFSN